MSEWSVLPNAANIDRVLESLKTHPEIWVAAWYAAWDAGRAEAWNAARAEAWNAARAEAWNAARAALAAQALGRLGAGAGASAAAGAVAALVVWDDSAEYLKLSGDELEVWARLSDDPRAVLLLPAVRAFEQIKKLDSV